MTKIMNRLNPLHKGNMCQFNGSLGSSVGRSARISPIMTKPVTPITAQDTATIKHSKTILGILAIYLRDVACLPLGYLTRMFFIFNKRERCAISGNVL